MINIDFKENIEEGQLFLINKELNWTSFDVVKKIKNLLIKHYKIKKIKVGHAGTLDPLASGLVIICVGKETKNIFKYQNQNKEYIAEIMLGKTTPSYDLETEVNQSFSIEHLNRKIIEDTLQKFIGKIKQVPPLYSAKWLGGKRAYEFARKGKKLDLEPREIEIEKIKIVSLKLPKLILEIKCSKGTYIRGLARDLGEVLNSGAYLSGLTRTAIGEFKLENAVTIKEFEKKLILNKTN